MKRPDGYRDRFALRITLAYAIISIIWILLSDIFLIRFSETKVITALSIIKGGVFVIITALLLYLLIKRTLIRIVNAEARTQILFDSVNDAIFLFSTDKDGAPQAFIDMNEAALNKFGYTRAELVGMPICHLIRDDKLAETIEAAKQLRQDGQVMFETILIAKDAHEIPVEISARSVHIGDEVMGISVARDLTERKRAEEERKELALATEMDKRRFYRETILAVTEGKFQICDTDEVVCITEKPLFTADFDRPEQISQVRIETVAFCIDQGLPENLAREFEIAIGEALANGVKHAGGGHLRAGKSNSYIWISVSDKGLGIDTFAIPNVALTTGFSTKASMGLGYMLMLKMSDRVILSTGASGTTVIIEKDLKPLSNVEQRISVFRGIK